MASIKNTHLEVLPFDEHVARRVVRVDYDLVAGPDDEVGSVEVREAIRVRGVGLGDAPVGANSIPVAVSESTFTLQEGTSRRTFEQVVRRSELDVEQDWWSSGNGGETQPIAEWVDHLVADIELSIDNTLVDEASTPIVTGSWGALGSD